MKKYVNGKYAEMTEEEIRALAATPVETAAPSPEERLQALETAYNALCTKLQTFFSI